MVERDELRKRVRAAIRRWAEIYGEPPGGKDWSPMGGRHERPDGEWPWAMDAVRAFGSWNAALVAAGFEPRAAHRPKAVA